MLKERISYVRRREKVLRNSGFEKGFGSGETRQEVLRGMNFSVAKGEFCVLLGPSGSESLHCSISSEASTAPIPDISV